MNKFTIILPVHNGGELVKKCIGSILSQEYTAFDLIVLENQSNDGTAEWLISLNDNRISIYPSDRLLSIEENWGRILQLKKNEFITIIGHDDLLLPDYLKTMDALIQKHPSATLF